MDKIERGRKDLQNWFKKLDFLSKNLQQKYELTTDEINKFDQFIESALVCHLDPNRKEKLEIGKTKRKYCLLCQVKDNLNQYECIIFDMVYENEEKGNFGSWNPTYQETILKSIYYYQIPLTNNY